MRWRINSLTAMLCVLVGWTGATTAQAARDASAFKDITERNVFGLRAPQAPVQPQAKPPALPKVTLTGITTVLDNKRALLKGPALSSPPGAPEQSFILTEGQREDYVEVVSIDEGTGSVTIRNCGQLMTLTFDKDGPKVPASPPPGALTRTVSPGYAPQPGPAVTNAGVAGATPTIPPLPPGMRQFPTRGYRLPSLATTPAANGTIQPQAVVPQPGVVLPPTGYTGQIQAAPEQPGADLSIAAPVQPTLSPEEQAALMEIQRELRNGNPQIPSSLPPTGLDTSRVYPRTEMMVPPGATSPGRPTGKR